MSAKQVRHLLVTLVLMLSAALGACAPAVSSTPTTPPAEPTAVPAEPSPLPIQDTAPVPPVEWILATTTSTQDSGLLDYLLPIFEQEFNAKIKVIAVGSGQAIQLGKDGDADVLLVHSPAAEKDFMAAGDGLRREDVMYNDFVIVGPQADPAKITGMKTAVEAFKAIAAAKATFISRGDKSGTNTKELAIWKAAGITPQGDWYLSAGQGMGAVLSMADEKPAYTLSDRATYLTQTKNGLQLKILVEGDALLLNPYGVISVNPAKNSKINNAMAEKFIDWIISVPTQEKIAAFQKDVFGISLFNPSSKLWKAAHGG